MNDTELGCNILPMRTRQQRIAECQPEQLSPETVDLPADMLVEIDRAYRAIGSCHQLLLSR